MSTVEFTDDTPVHLTKRSSGIDSNVQFSETELSDNEFWCRRCYSRVTRSPQKQCEYGHAPDCVKSVRREDWHSLNWRGDSA